MICAMELIELEHTYAILPNAFHVKMHVYVCIKKLFLLLLAPEFNN